MTDIEHRIGSPFIGGVLVIVGGLLGLLAWQIPVAVGVVLIAVGKWRWDRAREEGLL